MFSRLKGLGTSSSHAGGSSSDGRGLTVTFSLTSPGPAESTSRHRDAASQVRVGVLRASESLVQVSVLRASLVRATVARDAAPYECTA
jgi:hypothetical protein